MVLLGCLIVIILAGVAERLALARARRAVPIRIHVNGTRGKSTVTRLVAAALREAGVPTLAKVTGTAPRLILPDGSERTIRRLAPASIREQSWILRMARKCGARALVAECMAIRPDMQWTSERDILQSTHGIITNVRLDHTDVMGGSLDEITRSLATTIPRHGVMLTGDERAAGVLARRCEEEGCRLIVVEGSQIAPEPLCLAMAREVGVDEATARRGMRKATADPGAAADGFSIVEGRRVAWLDVTAANDPESTDLLVGRWGTGLDDSVQRAGGMLCVYNHRDDRPQRLAVFTRSCRALADADAVFITGDRPALPLLSRARRACRGRAAFVPARDLTATLARILAVQRGPTRVVYCGNTRGFVRPVLDR